MCEIFAFVFVSVVFDVFIKFFVDGFGCEYAIVDA